MLNWLRRIEYAVFFRLLRRFCERDLDQWEMLKTKTRYGVVYITIGRQPEIPDEEYKEI